MNLRPEDIEFERGLVRIRASKGKRDRYVRLPEQLSQNMRHYLVLNNSKYVFEGRKGKLSMKTVQKVFENASKKAGIKKKVSCHTLRHSFATHLLERWVDVRVIQKLLGHARLETTRIYTRVSDTHIRNVKSPLKDL